MFRELAFPDTARQAWLAGLRMYDKLLKCVEQCGTISLSAGNLSCKICHIIPVNRLCKKMLTNSMLVLIKLKIDYHTTITILLIILCLTVRCFS